MGEVLCITDINDTMYIYNPRYLELSTLLLYDDASPYSLCHAYGNIQYTVTESMLSKTGAYSPFIAFRSFKEIIMENFISYNINMQVSLYLHKIKRLLLIPRCVSVSNYPLLSALFPYYLIGTFKSDTKDSRKKTFKVYIK